MTRPHSPEPWRLVEVWDSIDEIEILDKDGKLIIAEEIFDESNEHPNFERITACINACQGIPACILEGGKLAIVPCKEGEHEYKEVKPLPKDKPTGVAQCSKCLDTFVIEDQKERIYEPI